MRGVSALAEALTLWQNRGAMVRGGAVSAKGELLLAQEIKVKSQRAKV